MNTQEITNKEEVRKRGKAAVGHLSNWLRRQYVEILESPEIEARAFLQFGQRHLINCKTTRIEWRSRDGRSRLRRHYIGLIHLECGHCELLS
jgi:hypothetical protein